MASLFNLKIIACDGVFYDGPSEMLIYPADDGEIAEICLRYGKIPGNEKNPLDKKPSDSL